jgi:cytochrome c556
VGSGVSRTFSRYVGAGFSRPFRLALAFAVLLATSTGGVLLAQKTYPIFTRDDFVKFMKTVGQNFGAVNASVAAGDFEAAKSQLTRSREQLAVTVTFWRDRKRDDALKFLKEAVTRMDDLDEALSAEKVDQARVATVLKQVNASCESCHTVYREYNPATKTYSFKAGTVQ